MVFRAARAVALAALVSIPYPVGAQGVLLQIRPHIGDTLRMHLSQTVEMTGTTIGSTAPDAARSMTTTIEIYTRAIARQWTASGTLMQTITDSVLMTPASPGALADLRRRTSRNKPGLIRVSGDGAVEVIDDGSPSSELRHLFGEMPAMLSRAVVAVGEKWTREMQIPLSGEPGAMGSVRATFQLDSLSRTGDIAFISIRGSLSRISLPRAVPQSAAYDATGTLTGTIQIDRRLGWITDSRSTIVVKSTIAAVAARRGEAERGVMVVRTRITQWIRAMRAR
ncbi:MAG TPA: DUF6263 family protein [Gemmatimonadaceae bacterium]|nr:DUF6263 family protein [Gemmatimonadaceae bacterium]